jgi:8-oxo-dGTP pyrophosphatase MutT (NUDIX family)
MGMSSYMRDLRDKVGHDYVLVPAAGALIRDDDGRVLLVQHVDGHWQLPGGTVDPDELETLDLRSSSRATLRTLLA